MCAGTACASEGCIKGEASQAIHIKDFAAATVGRRLCVVYVFYLSACFPQSDQARAGLP